MDQNVNCTFYFDGSEMNRKKLFQDALSFAKHGKVLYILREELHELPDLSQDLSTVSRHYMKMISFLYAKTLDLLVESISTLPDWQNVPSTIILDDLSQYCSKNNVQNACAVVALLIDGARSCSMILNEQCRVCVSVSETVGTEYCNMLAELYEEKTIN